MSATDTQPKESFQARLSIEDFDQFLGSLDGLVDDCTIHVTEDGFQAAAVDPANVAMVEASLPENAFHQLDGEAEFGLGTYKVRDLLDRELDADTVGLEWDSESRMLTLEVGPYSYEHATIDPRSIREEPDLPTLDLPCEITIQADRFKRAVEYFDEFSTHVTVTFDLDTNVFEMEAMEKRGKNVGTDQGAFDLHESDLLAVRPAEADSTFPGDYLVDTARGLPDRPVLLKVGEEFPLKLESNIRSEEGEYNGEVTYMIAPRIQS